MENHRRVTLNCRHPREGGNPDFQQTRPWKAWIPAIAGMTVLMCVSGQCFATDKPKSAKPMDGPGILRIFEGKAVTGVYADRTPVRESYDQGGGMNYWDPYRVTTGTWSVVNNQLCTFYDNPEMSGGCFRIEQVSANCFDYFAAATSTAEALTPSDKPQYTARASIDGTPETCPDELSV